MQLKSTSTKNLLSFFTAMLLALCGLSRAATVEWNPGLSGSGSSGGANTWLASSVFWTNVSTHSQAAWNNTTLDAAVFAGTAASVSGSGFLTNSGVTFNTTAYRLTAGTLVMSGASPAITVGSGLFATNNSAIIAASPTRFTGGGLLYAAGAHSGTFTVDAGTTLLVNGGTTLNAVSNLTVNGLLTHSVSDTGTGGPILNGTGTISGIIGFPNFRIGLQASTGTFSGNITGPTTLLWQGPGVQILTGSNDYSAATLLRSAGTLRLASTNALSPNTTIQFSTPSGNNVVELAAADFNATNVNTAGGVTFSGSTTAIFAALGADRTVNITNASLLQWGVGTFAVGTLGFGSVNSDHKIIWTGNVDLNGGARTITTLHGSEATAVEFRGVISDSIGTAVLTKTGTAGTMELTGANTWVGGTTLSGGVLALGNDSALGTGPLKFNTSSTLVRSLDASTRNLPNGVTFGADGTFGTPSTGDLIFNGAMDGGALSNVRTITISNAHTIFTGAFTSDAPASFVKAGPGVLVLAGDSTGAFLKALVVTNGALVLSNASVNNVIPGSTNISIKVGATLDVTAMTAAGGFQVASSQVLGGSGTVLGNVSVGSGAGLAPGDLNSAGTMTLSNDLVLTGGGTLYFDLTNTTTIGGGVNDLISVAGNLDLGAGDTTLTLTPLPPGGFVAGTYRLINYTGSLLGSGTLSVSAPPSRFVFTVDTNTLHQVKLIVTGNPGNLVWAGDGVGNPWDTTTANNWVLGGSPNFYFDLDKVTFNDSSTNLSINLNQTVTPTSVTVASTKSYTLQGTGKITGGAGLLKSGAGTLTVATANDFNGGTTISNGTVNVGGGTASASLGGGPVFINTSASLVFNNLSDSSLGSLSGGGALLQIGANTILSLNNNPGYAGTVSVQAGQVSILNANGFGANPGPTTVSANAGVFVSSVGITTFPQPFSLQGAGYNGADGALHIGASGQTYSGPFSLPADATIGFDFAASVATITGPISGPGSLTVTGPGTLVLAGTNTYNSTTVAGPGQLLIGNGGTNGTLGTNIGPVTVNTILAFNRSDTVTLSNQIIGPGALAQIGSGTLIVAATNMMDGSATNFSATVAGGGTLAVANDFALGTGALNMSGSTVRSADASLRVITNALTLSASMTFGSPGTGDLLFTGDMNTGSAAKTITINNGVTTFSGDLYGANASNANTKNGPGTMVITGTTSYSKPTTVSGGILQINGNFNGTGNITVSAGGTLAGTGTINPEVILTAFGILEVDPVNIGTLTVNNTILASGTPPIISLKLNKAAGTNDLIKTTHLALSVGTQLSLTNLAGNLAAGDSFKLFDSPSITGHFGTIVPAIPGPGLFWDTNTFNVDGAIRVSALQFSAISHLGDGSVQLSGSGPNGSSFRILASTNVALPAINWDVLTNDIFVGGAFSFLDQTSTNYPRRFYRVISP